MAALNDDIASAIATHEKLNPGIDLIQIKGEGTTNDITDDVYIKHTAAKDATTESAGDAVITSAAFAFGQGTSIAVGWGREDVNDGENQFAALGHSYGAGSVAIYYARGEMMEDGAMTEGSHWGVAVGHDVGGGVDAYAGYRVMQEDHKEDVSLLLAGMRVKFN